MAPHSDGGWNYSTCEAAAAATAATAAGATATAEVGRWDRVVPVAPAAPVAPSLIEISQQVGEGTENTISMVEGRWTGGWERGKGGGVEGGGLESAGAGSGMAACWKNGGD